MPAAKRHRFNGPCSILSLNPAKISPSHRSPSNPVGFITDGVVYNLLGLLHTGGHKHLAVGVRLYLLPSELLDVALPQPGQAAEKECPFQYFFLIGRFGKPYQFLLAQMLPYGGDALDAV